VTDDGLERIDRDDPGAVLSRLTRTATAVARRIEAALAADGLTIGECDVLQELLRGEGQIVTASTLSSTLVLSPGALTHRLDRLESAGLVERGRRHPDRRNLSVHLTSKGRSLVEAAITRRIAVEKEIVAAYSPADLSRFDSYLHLLADLGTGARG